ncbi:MAG: hypothetical protein U5L11_16565 [Arhodomonas sp.]|nr:hypothetical protein [Arhodomonas sp.]
MQCSRSPTTTCWARFTWCSLQRGLDPRDFTLVASGRARPGAHWRPDVDLRHPAGARCRTTRAVLGVRLHHDRRPRGPSPHRPADLPGLRRRSGDGGDDRVSVNDAVGELRAQGYAQDIEIYRSIEARYLGQNHELELTVPTSDFSEDQIKDLWKRFHEEHEKRFSFSIPGETIETVNLKVVAVALSDKPKLPELADAKGSPDAKGAREVRYEQGLDRNPGLRSLLPSCAGTRSPARQ